MSNKSSKMSLSWQKKIEEKIKAAMGVNNIMIMGESEMNEVDE